MVFVLYQTKNLFQMLTNDLGLILDVKTDLALHTNSEHSIEYKYAISQNQVTDVLLTDDALASNCNLVIYIYFDQSVGVSSIESINTEDLGFVSTPRIAQINDASVIKKSSRATIFDNIVSVAYVCSLYDAQVLFLGVHNDIESITSLKKILNDKLEKILEVEYNYYKNEEVSIDDAFKHVNSNIDFITSLISNKKKGDK